MKSILYWKKKVARTSNFFGASARVHSNFFYQRNFLVASARLALLGKSEHTSETSEATKAN
jgi:hypothetical protein